MHLNLLGQSMHSFWDAPDEQSTTSAVLEHRGAHIDGDGLAPNVDGGGGPASGCAGGSLVRLRRRDLLPGRHRRGPCALRLLTLLRSLRQHPRPRHQLGLDRGPLQQAWLSTSQRCVLHSIIRFAMDFHIKARTCQTEAVKLQPHKSAQDLLRT